MAKFHPPADFDFVPERWAEWSTRWSRFQTLSELKKKPAQQQIDCLPYLMGSRSETIFNSLDLSEEDKQDYGKVIQGFDKYFSPRKYVIFERATFFRHDQIPGESVEEFILTIKNMAGQCDFGDYRLGRIHQFLKPDTLQHEQADKICSSHRVQL